MLDSATMARAMGMLLTAAAICSGGAAAPVQAQARAAAAVADRAIERMGGEAALRSVERVRFDMMTQWQRTGFRDMPWTDRPSFEPHVDVRDYRIPAWRNTRDFGARSITNVVRDSVAITDFGSGFQPLSVAYVDERRELFAYTPDRLVLLVRDAPDLTMAGDTLIGGEPHILLAATLAGRLPATVAFHAGTGLPTRLRFRAGHPNDFGLVPWGEMWVEVWYSSWRTFGDISIPAQWDILRVGRPYKRMTVRTAAFNPTFAPDSFTVPDPLRQQFIDTRRPMHDLHADSVTLAAPGLVAIHGFGSPAGAVQLGDEWLLLEAGHTPLNLERGEAALADNGVPGIAAAIVVAARPGNAGILDLVRRSVPIYTSRAAESFVNVMLANAGERWRSITVVTEARWVEIGGERVRLEPMDLPDLPGSLLLYVPRLAWVYAADAVTPLDVRIALDHARERGWNVAAVGTARALWSTVAR
jgi:hypothetical protein